MISVGGHLLRLWLQPWLRCGLSAQFSLQGRELPLDVLLCFAPPDDFFAIPPQEIIDGLDANPDGAGGLVLVQILEAEIRRAGLLDNALNHAINGRIVSALETRNFKRNQIRMPRGKFR